MMLLSEIIGNDLVSGITGRTDIPISGLAFDSRKVMPGNLFFAVRGTTSDGHDFIGTAIEKGSSAVVCEQVPAVTPEGITFVVTGKSSLALGLMASRFHGDPSGKLKLIGVTGTNGKTTTVTLLHRLFFELGFGAGLISTINNMVNLAELPATHTTPDPLQLNELLARMAREGCTYCFMEVSSHALVLQRVYGIRFHAALFTNLSMEHLDFHASMQEYASAKQQLFDQLAPAGFAVFNIDDPYAVQMAERIAPEKIYCCSLRSGAAPVFSCCRFFKADILQSTLASSTVTLHFPDTVMTMQVGLPGVFNVMNELEAAAIGSGMGLAPEVICRSLSEISTVEGRMERIGDRSQGGSVFVDYAHTPDALFKALDTLRSLKPERSRLIVVFGCGGNRDRLKRPEMGRIASETADEVIITADNPRDEDPELILDEIERGITGSRYRRISDRSEAIRAAVSMLKQGDVLLVAGKGHEKFQEISGHKHYFSDRDILRQCLQENGAGYLEKERKPK